MIEDGLGFSRAPENRPSSVVGQRSSRRSTGALGASALWDQSTPKLSFWYESLRWSTTTSTERIAFARKRLSIGATNRQRSPDIVATVTTG
jgi:hypothetical protein